MSPFPLAPATPGTKSSAMVGAQEPIVNDRNECPSEKNFGSR